MAKEKPKLKLAKKHKEAIATGLAEFFFEYWQAGVNQKKMNDYRVAFKVTSTINQNKFNATNQ